MSEVIEEEGNFYVKQGEVRPGDRIQFRLHDKHYEAKVTDITAGINESMCLLQVLKMGGN